MVRNDLKIYKYKELEFVFIEIINRKGKNTIVGCIYRHPCMEVTEFNDVFLQNIPEKLSYENKEIIIMGDFNTDILKSDNNSDSAMFLDNIYENLLIPYIISPTRVTHRSQTLIDNIFLNIIEKGIISGNITTTISDNYMQFVLFKNKTKSQANKKKAKFARNHKSLNKDLLEYDLRNTKWDEILKVNTGNVDFSFESFLKTFIEILDKHAPYKKLSLQEVKLSYKPWITTGILNSIKNKNRIHTKVIRAKKPSEKNKSGKRIQIIQNTTR